MKYSFYDKYDYMLELIFLPDGHPYFRFKQIDVFKGLGRENYTQDIEQWEKCPKYEIIEVSTHGQVRTIDRIITDKNGQKRKVKGKLLKQHNDGNGYLYVGFSYNGKNVSPKVHRLAAITFLKKIFIEANQVNHKDGNTLNNNINNLEWCTHKDNTNHYYTQMINRIHYKGVIYENISVLVKALEDYNKIEDTAEKIRIKTNRALHTGGNLYGYEIGYLSDEHNKALDNFFKGEKKQ